MSADRSILEKLSWIAGIAGAALGVYAFLNPQPPPKDPQVTVTPAITVATPPAPPTYIMLVQPSPERPAIGETPATPRKTDAAVEQIDLPEPAVEQIDAPEPKRPSIQESSSTLPLIRPSFDCTKATTPVANAVCTDPKLALADFRLDDIYVRVMNANPSSKPRIRSSQQEWIRNIRDRCRDRACLLAAYLARIQELQAMPH